MTTVYIAGRLQSLDSFILERCTNIPPEEQPALCENIALLNRTTGAGLVLCYSKHKTSAAEVGPV